VDQVHLVRHKVLVESLSQRQAARQLGLSRNTVAKYFAISAPARIEKLPRPKPVLSQVLAHLNAPLEEWRGRTTAKQRLTGSRLHRQLVEEGWVRDSGLFGLPERQERRSFDFFASRLAFSPGKYDY